MQRLEQLQRKLKNAEDLRSVVHTMKVMSAVEIYQFEEAVESLRDYFDTIEMGMQVVLKKVFEESTAPLFSTEIEKEGWLILGSGQALCGSFDKVIADYIHQKKTEGANSRVQIYTCGERLGDLLMKDGFSIDKKFEMPGSVSGIIGLVLELISGIEHWQMELNIQSVRVFHNQPVQKRGFIPIYQNLLPPKTAWMNRIKEKKWPTNKLPQFKIDSGVLFQKLLRQYLFVSLYRAVAESLAAEYSSRLSAMQRAEQKIDERLEQLKQSYSTERQSAITEELLDIIAGFEAIQSREKETME